MDWPERHAIRGSVWYAFGLLMRNGPDDRARAVRVLETVLNNQFDAPGRIFHGTFLRAPEEPYPPADAVIQQEKLLLVASALSALIVLSLVIGFRRTSQGTVGGFVGGNGSTLSLFMGLTLATAVLGAGTLLPSLRKP